MSTDTATYIGMSITLDKAFSSWEGVINKALFQGTGKYSGFTSVGDLWAYKKIIDYARAGMTVSAAAWADSLDSEARDRVPVKIRNWLERFMTH